MTDRILRVFPRRTAMTPDDDLVRIGPPGLYDHELIARVDRVHVSCVFTWDRDACEHLAVGWQDYLDVSARLGGPAFGSPCDGFDPGMYVRPGVTFTSRGCPNKCPWCLVPDREGDIKEIPIRSGNIIQDNNILACSHLHFAAVCEMLAAQRRRAVWKGGLEAVRLTAWHLKAIREIKSREVWTAADNSGNDICDAVRRAIAAFREFLGRRMVRCYVLVGFGGDTPGAAESRLEAVWDAGALPAANLYHGPEALARRDSADWRALMRRWRPAAAFDLHKALAHPSPRPSPTRGEGANESGAGS